MERALVTGSTGFIGRHLVGELSRRGYEVSCLVRSSSRRAPLVPFASRFVLGDVTDPGSLREAVRGVDVVFHLAGLLKAHCRLALHAANEAGAGNVIEAAASRTSPPVVVLVSSLAAAGPSPRQRPLLEDDPCRPVSTYGRSKLAGERAAEALAHAAPITVVRPPIVFGEGDTETFRLFALAGRGLFPVVGLRPSRLSLVHVEDLVAGLITAARRGERLAGRRYEEPDHGHGRYYIADEDAPDMAALGRRMGLALGRRRVLPLPSPKAVSWVAGAACEAISRLRGRPSIVCLDKVREGTAGDWVCSAAKALSTLGFSPSAGLDERLLQTALWYRDQGWMRF